MYDDAMDVPIAIRTCLRLYFLWITIADYQNRQEAVALLVQCKFPA